MQEKVTGEAEYTGEFFGTGYTSEEGYCPSLREPTCSVLMLSFWTREVKLVIPNTIREDGIPFSISALMRELK